MKDKLRKPLWLAAICLFVIWIIIGYRYQFTYNHGDSMEPTYSNGDWIVVEKRNKLPKNWRPDRYDVVIIRHEKDKESLCKRVIGLEGDKIRIERGRIFLNGKELKDPFGNGPIDLLDAHSIIVPQKQVWIIGDNRSCTWYGLLPIEDIEGLVIL